MCFDLEDDQCGRCTVLPTQLKAPGGEAMTAILQKMILSKNEAMLTAEEELVWAREWFRADCAARAVQTCQDAARHYISIRDARAAVITLMRAHSI